MEPPFDTIEQPFGACGPDSSEAHEKRIREGFREVKYGRKAVSDDTLKASGLAVGFDMIRLRSPDSHPTRSLTTIELLSQQQPPDGLSEGRYASTPVQDE